MYDKVMHVQHHFPFIHYFTVRNSVPVQQRMKYAWFERNTHKEKTPWPESTSELYQSSDHHLSAKLVLTFAGRGVSRSQRSRSPTSIISDF
jgi:hypothetical protein